MLRYFIQTHAGRWPGYFETLDEAEALTGPHWPWWTICAERCDVYNGHHVVAAGGY